MLIDIQLNFAASAVFVIVAMLTLWLISLKIKDASIVDMFWGAGFGFIALLCLSIPYLLFDLSAFGLHITPYQYLLIAMPILWAIRYTVYIIRRNWGHGEDKRYQAIRKNVTEKQWPWYSLRVVFLNQGLAMMIVAAPIWVAIATTSATVNLPCAGLHYVNKTQIGTLSIIGTIIWLIGFLFEAIGDFQLSRFIARRKELGAEVTGKVMDKGLWRYSRHPNYFGNVLMWWGIWLVACQAPWGWATIISPLFMTLALVKLTGAAHLERTMSKRPEYAEYMRRTSMFVPLPPKKRFPKK